MSTDKNIFKNILYLYGKMAITIVISLYATRIILENLGEKDFGLYNVVAGIVVIFSFINTTLSTSTIRHISYALGKNDIILLRRTFSSSFIIHLVIALILFFFLEIAGIYLIDNQLLIDPSKIYSAKILLHLVVLSTLVTIISVPYEGLINASEKMGFLAITGLIESFLNLIAALLLSYELGLDKLVFYGVLMLFKSVIIRLIKQVYCRINFREIVSINYFRNYDISSIKELSSFAGWNLFGVFLYMLKNQGVTVLFNVFFGTFINASYAIASQVNGQVQMLSLTIIQAMEPQIVKSESGGNQDRLEDLMKMATKISFSILAIVSIPLFLNINYVFAIWLKNVPKYTIVFTELILVVTLIQQLRNGITIVAHAKNELKKFQLINTPIQLMCLPLGYLFLKQGFEPYYVLIAIIFIEVIAVLINIVFLTKVTTIKYGHFLYTVVLKNIGIFGLTYGLSFCGHLYFSKFFNNFLLLILSSGLSVTIYVSLFFLFLSSSEMESLRKLFLKLKQKIIK